MSETARPCRLSAALGITEECPEESCPFWEPGGAVLEGRCAFERVDLTGRRDLLDFPLLLRADLRTVETKEEREVRHARG